MSRLLNKVLDCGTVYDIQFKGFGISFTDDQPKEVIYIRLDDIDIKYEDNTYKESADGNVSQLHQETLTLTKADVKIGNF